MAVTAVQLACSVAALQAKITSACGCVGIEVYGCTHAVTTAAEPGSCALIEQSTEGLARGLG